MNIFSRIGRRVWSVSPFPELMSGDEYRRVSKMQLFARGTTTVFGMPVEFSNSEGLLHSLKELFQDEVYRFASDNSTPFIIDAGANIGLSVLFFKRLYPGCKIVAFEPDPLMFELLSNNVKAWKFDNVELKNSAAWTESGELTFYREGSLAGSTEIDFLDKGDVINVRSEKLRDELVGKDVDFLKIDIEGAENYVLPDVEPELARVKALFFEYHSAPGKQQELATLLSIATRQGFRYAISGAHCTKHPFVDRTSSGFDLQLNVSCFRP